MIPSQEIRPHYIGHRAALSHNVAGTIVTSSLQGRVGDRTDSYSRIWQDGDVGNIARRGLAATRMTPVHNGEITSPMVTCNAQGEMCIVKERFH